MRNIYVSLYNNMKVRVNKTKKIYTIWINGIKYKSLPMSKVEFEEAYYFTLNDWKNYLRQII